MADEESGAVNAAANRRRQGGGGGGGSFCLPDFASFSTTTPTPSIEPPKQQPIRPPLFHFHDSTVSSHTDLGGDSSSDDDGELAHVGVDRYYPLPFRSDRTGEEPISSGRYGDVDGSRRPLTPADDRDADDVLNARRSSGSFDGGDANGTGTPLRHRRTPSGALEHGRQSDAKRVSRNKRPANATAQQKSTPDRRPAMPRASAAALVPRNRSSSNRKPGRGLQRHGSGIWMKVDGVGGSFHRRQGSDVSGIVAGGGANGHGGGGDGVHSRRGSAQTADEEDDFWHDEPTLRDVLCSPALPASWTEDSDDSPPSSSAAGAFGGASHNEDGAVGGGGGGGAGGASHARRSTKHRLARQQSSSASSDHRPIGGEGNEHGDDDDDDPLRKQHEHYHHRVRRATSVSAFVTFLKALLGVSMLSNPRILGDVGFVLGTVAHLLLAVCCTFACYLLLVSRGLVVTHGEDNVDEYGFLVEHEKEGGGGGGVGGGGSAVNGGGAVEDVSTSAEGGSSAAAAAVEGGGGNETAESQETESVLAAAATANCQGIGSGGGSKADSSQWWPSSSGGGWRSWFGFRSWPILNNHNNRHNNSHPRATVKEMFAPQATRRMQSVKESVGCVSDYERAIVVDSSERAIAAPPPPGSRGMLAYYNGAASHAAAAPREREYELRTLEKDAAGGGAAAAAVVDPAPPPTDAEAATTSAAPPPTDAAKTSNGDDVHDGNASASSSPGMYEVRVWDGDAPTTATPKAVFRLPSVASSTSSSSSSVEPKPNSVGGEDDWAAVVPPPRPPPAHHHRRRHRRKPQRLVTYGDLAAKLVNPFTGMLITAVIITLHVLFASGMISLAVDNFTAVLGWSSYQEGGDYDDHRSRSLGESGDDRGDSGSDDRGSGDREGSRDDAQQGNQLGDDAQQVIGRLAFSGFLFPVVYVLLQIPTLTDLFKVSTAGLVTYLVGCVGTMIYSTTVLSDGEPFDAPNDMWEWKWEGMPAFVATTVYAIEGINLALPTANSLAGGWKGSGSDGSSWGGGSGRAIPIVCFAVLIYGLITLLIGWIGFLGGLGGGVGTRHEEDGCREVAYCLNSSGVQTVHRLSLGVALILTLPVILYPSTELLEVWWAERVWESRLRKRRLRQKEESGADAAAGADAVNLDGNKGGTCGGDAAELMMKRRQLRRALIDDTDSESESQDGEGNAGTKDDANVEQSRRRPTRVEKHWRLRTALAVIVTVLGAAEPFIKSLTGFLRGMGLSFAGFILPPLLYMSATGGRFHPVMAVALAVLIGLGMFNVALVCISSFTSTDYMMEP